MALPTKTSLAAPSWVADRLRRWLERAEVLARGGESLRISAEQALRDERLWEAHAAARRLTDLVPGSKVGWLLLADSAQALGLSEDALDALTRLSIALPFRADVWLRKAQLEAALGNAPRAALERADAAGWPADAADSARVWLCDLDLWLGDVRRAERWLKRCGSASRELPGWRWRQIEVLLDLGDTEAALALAVKLEQPEVLDARSWLTQGRVWAAQADPAAAWALERALLLEAPRSGPVVAEYLVSSQDALFLIRIREVIEALGYLEHPGWQAALAQAEGRIDVALAALERGAREAPDVAWLQRLALVAEQARSWSALELARDGLRTAGARLPVGLEALAGARELAPEQRLERLLAISPAPSSWASELVDEAASWLLRPRWPALLGWLGALALRSGDLALRGELEAISVELERPLRVAIVGEFNAGKSSFINAWLGSDVAPVGVIPTTAKTHRLAWAPDPYVRVEYGSGQERVLPHAELSAELAAEPAVRRVVIYSPLDTLRHLELIDTPGFNSSEAEHTAEVEAALADAHVALWLMDAGQPFKASERLRLQELQRRGVALLVLVNKRDRLSDAQAAQALEHITAGLRGSAIELYYPVTFVSAKNHIEARTAAQATSDQRASGWWGGVERLIEQLRADAPKLKDAALLHRLGRLLPVAPIAEPAIRTETISVTDPLDALDPEALLRDTLTQLLPDLRPLQGVELESDAGQYAASRTALRLSAALQRAIPDLARPEAGDPHPLLGLAGAWGAGAWRSLRALSLEDAASADVVPLAAELMQALRGWTAERVAVAAEISVEQLFGWLQLRISAAQFAAVRRVSGAPLALGRGVNQEAPSQLDPAAHSPAS